MDEVLDNLPYHHKGDAAALLLGQPCHRRSDFLKVGAHVLRLNEHDARRGGSVVVHGDARGVFHLQFIAICGGFGGPLRLVLAVCVLYKRVEVTRHVRPFLLSFKQFIYAC